MITFENGTKASEAYVTISGVKHYVTPAQYTGKTPLNATNLNANFEELDTSVKKLDTAVKSIQNTLSTIIESGSNSNGTWIKYDNGIMICYKNFSGTVKITQSWYSLYETSAANALDFGNYPQSFIETPLVFTQFYGGNSQWVNGWVDNTRTASKVGKAVVCSASSKTAGAYYNIIAIGKWK